MDEERLRYIEEHHFTVGSEVVMELVAEVRRLRAALAEYADSKNWINDGERRWNDSTQYDIWAPNEDGPNRARRALDWGDE